MLVKSLSRQNIGYETVEAAAAAAPEALDALWRERWITASVTRSDLREASELAAWAEDIRSRAGLVVIAAGAGRSAIKAALDACPGGEGSPEILVWDGSMSPGDLAEIVKKVEKVNTVLIAVSDGDEPLELRAAYTVIKQAVFAAHHDKEGEKVYAVCPRSRGLIALDAEENVYPRADWPEGSWAAPAGGTAGCFGNKAAVLLPLLIKGADVESYLGGFYDTVGSPDWDRDAALPAYVMAEAKAEIGAEAGSGLWAAPEVISWQKETRAMARWAAEMAGGRLVRMPEGAKAGQPAFRIMISADSGHEDIMTPPFDGCDADGSLELLLRSESDRAFFDGAEEDGIHGFSFCTEELDARSAGALMAYLQMTIWLFDEYSKKIQHH